MVGTYWQDNLTSNPLSDLHANVNTIFVAFAKGSDATSGTLVERGVATSAYTQSAMISAIAARQAAGKCVILSIGGSDDVIGSSGVQYTLSTTTQINNAVSSLTSLITTYGFDGIDWDLESAYKFTVAAMVDVTNQLKTAFPSLIVTLTPEHFDANNTSGMYRQVATALGSNLSVIQPQFYNASFFTSKAVWQAQITNVVNSLSTAYGESRIAVGLEVVGSNIASADSGGYTMTPAEVNAILDSLYSSHPNLRGAFVWSSNSDKGASYPFANTVGTHLLAITGGGATPPTSGGEDLPANFW